MPELQSYIRIVIQLYPGQAGWSLPQAEIEFPNIEQKYCWLAFFILNGNVFPKLKDYRQHLLSKPDLIVKPWLKL